MPTALFILYTYVLLCHTGVENLYTLESMENVYTLNLKVSVVSYISLLESLKITKLLSNELLSSIVDDLCEFLP